ncbi:unnamed protein product [Ceratitis capitata]|uniref:(Mediterranean fruit fly) hypothetical protein n=1 Tax=Ceratitis capitata TaxID=7213 RepID=A0A811VCD7_CERCA|nr:unnamed protein product [Ceratitis capitata]
MRIFLGIYVHAKRKPVRRYCVALRLTYSYASTRCAPSYQPCSQTTNHPPNELNVFGDATSYTLPPTLLGAFYNNMASLMELLMSSGKFSVGNFANVAEKLLVLSCVCAKVRQLADCGDAEGLT